MDLIDGKAGLVGNHLVLRGSALGLAGSHQDVILDHLAIQPLFDSHLIHSLLHHAVLRTADRNKIDNTSTTSEIL